MQTYDIAVLGGGPAGMAAALSGEHAGKSVLLVDKNPALGGVLNQCIHDGFGLTFFKENLTGPEYALRFRRMVEASGVEVRLRTPVLSISPNKTITTLSVRGQERFAARSIVTAFGSREFSAGYIGINGTRPAEGVITAGAAQKRVNCMGELIGREVVILGSSDPGLVMARRMVTEGAKVILVAEPKPYSEGSVSGIVHCLSDNKIPLRFNTTVTRVTGKERLTGVYIAKVDKKRQPVLTTEQYIPCDTLLLAAGMHPEGELLTAIGARSYPKTGGAAVDEFCQTSLPGFFSCGNCLHVHGTADDACIEGGIVGASAAKYVDGGLNQNPVLPVLAGKGIAAVLPNVLHTGSEGSVPIQLLASQRFVDRTVAVYAGKKAVRRCKMPILTPGIPVTLKIERALATERILVEVL